MVLVFCHDDVFVAVTKDSHLEVLDSNRHSLVPSAKLRIPLGGKASATQTCVVSANPQRTLGRDDSLFQGGRSRHTRAASFSGRPIT
jgi:hypothetical protein